MDLVYHVYKDFFLLLPYEVFLFITMQFIDINNSFKCICSLCQIDPIKPAAPVCIHQV